MANLYTIDSVEGLIPAAMHRPSVVAAYWEAYNLRGAVTDNPYNPTGDDNYCTPEAAAWVDGWHAGHQEALAWATFGDAGGL